MSNKDENSNKEKNKPYYSIIDKNVPNRNKIKSKFIEEMREYSEYDRFPLLQDNMDEKTLERYNIVNKCEFMYLEKYLKTRNTENADFVKRKIDNLKYSIGQKIYEKCYEEIKIIKKFFPLTKVDENITNLPIYSESEEYNSAHQSFLHCSSFERYLITRLEDKIRFLSFVYDYQYSMCKKNCIESKFYTVNEDYENCINICLKFTNKNIDPAIEGVIENLVEDYSQMLEGMSGTQKL